MAELVGGAQPIARYGAVGRIGRKLLGAGHYSKAYNVRSEPFVWTKKKARQRRFKDRRITEL